MKVINMKIDINGNMINEEKDFHSQIAKALGVQQYYGCNLDALWDLLSASVERPVHIAWKNSSESRKNLGAQFGRIISVLDRVRLQDEEYGWEHKFTYSLD